MSAPTRPRIRFDSAQELAQRAAAERVLNAYLREAGRTPVGWPDQGPLEGRRDGKHSLALPIEVVGGQHELLWLPLPACNCLILGTIRRHSQVGLHRFGRAFWWRPLRPQEGAEPRWESLGPSQVIERILEELAADSRDPIFFPASDEGTPGRSQGLREKLMEQILNSIEKTARYLHSTVQRDHSEQTLLFGHPFHPTPKSSEGFDPADLQRYAPELGASFQLEYLEVAPELLIEEHLSGHPLPLAGLLPCHPWQAQFLRSQEWMQELVRTGQVRFLGVQGETVQPTSSVRTVRCGDHYLKLPLNVRITNFFRLNCEEHLRRSLDVCRAIVAGPAPSAQVSSTILLENGWRTVRLPDDQAAQLGVLFRRAPTGPEPVVVAALLETGPDGEAQTMTELLEKAGGLTPPDLGIATRWLRAYLAVALPAVLGWWLERGVSLEAHVQNTLVTICKGWPTRLYLRDLEGGSLWKEHPAATWQSVGIDPESPAIYTESQAWQRLLYYFFVNHLGHLVATLALASNSPEDPLWREVNQAIRQLPEVGPEGLTRKYRDKLLNAAHLPAKANLTSRFQERSENPIYVAIPNPFADVAHAPRSPTAQERAGF